MYKPFLDSADLIRHLALGFDVYFAAKDYQPTRHEVLGFKVSWVNPNACKLTLLPRNGTSKPIRLSMVKHLSQLYRPEY